MPLAERDSRLPEGQRKERAQAYADRDPKLAAKTLARHIERSRDVVIQALAKLGGVL